jgi:hypothetical protein
MAHVALLSDLLDDNARRPANLQLLGWQPRLAVSIRGGHLADSIQQRASGLLDLGTPASCRLRHWTTKTISTSQF